MLASVHWYDWAGLVGVVLTLLAYFLLQARARRCAALSADECIRRVRGAAVAAVCVQSFGLRARVPVARYQHLRDRARTAHSSRHMRSNTARPAPHGLGKHV